jgi:tRNA threonylcarbamoyl adenosine modification protein YjeE
LSESSQLKILIENEQQMHNLGFRLGSILQPGDLVSLNGVLGAGKTTLTKAIGEGAGVQGVISSPTFLIARTHPTNSGSHFVHIDAYRLSSPSELDDLDINYPNSISVIEWGQGFTDGLSESILEIHIERFLETEERRLTFSGHGRVSEVAELRGETT